jgi:hypothetical protein
MTEKSTQYKAAEKRMHEKLVTAYNKIKTCPVCQKELEINPITEFKACFVHGDFEIQGHKIVWRNTDW